VCIQELADTEISLFDWMCLISKKVLHAINAG
jgi:hypothetical protein